MRYLLRNVLFILTLLSLNANANLIQNGNFNTCDYAGWERDTDGLGDVSLGNDFEIDGIPTHCRAKLNVDYFDIAGDPFGFPVSEAFFANTLFQELDFTGSKGSTFELTIDFEVWSETRSDLEPLFIADYFLIGLNDGFGNYFNKNGDPGFLVKPTDIDGNFRDELTFEIDSSFLGQTGWFLDFQINIGWGDISGLSDAYGSTLYVNNVSLVEVKVPVSEVPEPSGLALLLAGIVVMLKFKIRSIELMKYFLLFTFLFSARVAAQFENLDSRLNIETSKQYFDRVNRTVNIQVTLRNISSTSIDGPLYLSLEDIGVNLITPHEINDDGTLLVRLPLASVFSDSSQNFTLRYGMTRSRISPVISVLRDGEIPKMTSSQDIKNMYPGVVFINQDALQNESTTLVKNIVSSQTLPITKNIQLAKAFDDGFAQMIIEENDTSSFSSIILHTEDGGFSIDFETENSEIFTSELEQLYLSGAFSLELSKDDTNYILTIPKELMTSWSASSPQVTVDGDPVEVTIIEDDPVVSFSKIRPSSTIDASTFNCEDFYTGDARACADENFFVLEVSRDFAEDMTSVSITNLVNTAAALSDIYSFGNIVVGTTLTGVVALPALKAAAATWFAGSVFNISVGDNTLFISGEPRPFFEELSKPETIGALHQYSYYYPSATMYGSRIVSWTHTFGLELSTKNYSGESNDPSVFFFPDKKLKLKISASKGYLVFWKKPFYLYEGTSGTEYEFTLNGAPGWDDSEKIFYFSHPSRILDQEGFWSNGKYWRSLNKTIDDWTYADILDVCNMTTGRCFGTKNGVNFNNSTIATNEEVRAMLEDVGDLPPGSLDDGFEFFNHSEPYVKRILDVVGGLDYNSVEQVSVKAYTRNSRVPNSTQLLFPTVLDNPNQANFSFGDVIGNHLSDINQVQRATGIWLYKSN